MAIDPVRVKHEAWMKGVTSVLAWSVFAFQVWNGWQHHQAWDDFLRQNWIWLMLAISAMPWGWSPIAAMLIFPIVAWADFHDKPLTVETFRQLPLFHWFVLPGCLLFFVIILLLIHGMMFGKRPAGESLPS